MTRDDGTAVTMEGTAIQAASLDTPRQQKHWNRWGGAGTAGERGWGGRWVHVWKARAPKQLGMQTVLLRRQRALLEALLMAWPPLVLALWLRLQRHPQKAPLDHAVDAAAEPPIKGAAAEAPMICQVHRLE